MKDLTLDKDFTFKLCDKQTLISTSPFNTWLINTNYMVGKKEINSTELVV